METEINIVEILKDKPANTKLYSPLFSEVFFFACKWRLYSCGTSWRYITILK